MKIDMTKELIKAPIPKPTIHTIEMSDETLNKFNELLCRDTEMDGIPDKEPKFNKCPVCGSYFMNDMDKRFCYKCGQRIRFVESDIVPL